MNLRKLYYGLSPKLRRTARRLYYLPIDLYEGVLHKRHPLQPPRGKIYTDGGDFLKEGRDFLIHFKDLCKLEPHHRVLDIGSGIGRMAIPLTEYLNEKGTYEGFDIVEEGVAWCQQKISSKYPNFNFKLVTLKNDLYSKEGSSAKDFIFPYGNKEFDFSFLTSVFTHMLPEPVENYLKEISRVLKPNGRCLATFFILDEAVKKRISNNEVFNFKYDYGNYRLMDDKVKSANVAFELEFINKLAAKVGLKIEGYHPGYWSGLKKEDCLNFQDLLVFSKS